jgi:thiol-disulfide isomerase/thioredoxin
MKTSVCKSAPHAIGLTLMFFVLGADRPAAKIVEEYQAVEFPKADPQSKDANAIEAFRQKWADAEAHKAALALELFRSHPDNELVPKALLLRWQARMMSRDTARATIAEIDEALPRFTDTKWAREASYMKAIATIIANARTPQSALSVIDDFIRHDPKDLRGALLLSGLAESAQDSTFKIALLRRLISDFPKSAVASEAEAKIAALEIVGKPFDIAFTDAISGGPVSIKSLKGKVVVIDFWATWCGPCVAEMPAMKSLYSQYRDQGVEFIGVSLDRPKDEGGLDKLKAFVAKNEIRWPQYYLGNGWENDLPRKMAISSIPQVFLVDSEGCLASTNARGALQSLIPEYLARAKKSARPN